MVSFFLINKFIDILNCILNLSGTEKGEEVGCDSSQQGRGLTSPGPLVVPEEGRSRDSPSTGHQVGPLPGERADIWPGSQPAVRPRLIRSVARTD